MVLAIIIALFGLVVYGLTVVTLYWQIDGSLRETARGILSSSRVNTELSVIAIPQLDRFGVSGIYVQIWKSDGTWSASSDNLQHYRDPLDPGALTQTSQTLHDVLVAGAHLRVMTIPINPDGHLLGRCDGERRSRCSWAHLQTSSRTFTALPRSPNSTATRSDFSLRRSLRSRGRSEATQGKTGVGTCRNAPPRP